MIPAIIMAAQMLQQKAQAQNQQNQAMADQMRNNQLVQNQQPQLPTIQSVFGQRQY